MAFLGQAFDLNSVEPAEDLQPIPSGEYVAIITDSEVKATKTNSGEYLELTHQVIEGEYKGRLVWGRLNIINVNPKAQQIAQQQLSSICHALGIQQAITDSEELHNRPLVIRVEYVPENGQYRAKNEIKAWKGLPDQPAPARAAPRAPAQAPRQAAPAAPSTPPWRAGAAR